MHKSWWLSVLFVCCYCCRQRFGADGDFFRPSFNGESKCNTLGFGNDPNGTRREKVWAVVVYHMLY
jgi:hypothetical protein